MDNKNTITPKEAAALNDAAAQYSSPESYRRPSLTIETVKVGDTYLHVIRDVSNFSSEFEDFLLPYLGRFCTIDDLTPVFEKVRHLQSLAVHFFEKKPILSLLEETNGNPA